MMSPAILYDPYGRPTFMDGTWGSPGGTSGKENRILYAGYFWDAESGLYHVRHRMYHPTLGRWMQRDPAGYVDGMLSWLAVQVESSDAALC